MSGPRSRIYGCGVFATFFLGLVVPQLPAGEPALDAAALAARVDEYVAARWAATRLKPSPTADDAAFIRRAYLDLVGRIPPAMEVRRFLSDKSPDKRERLVERLLDSPGYVMHFTNVWRAVMLPEG